MPCTEQGCGPKHDRLPISPFRYAESRKTSKYSKVDVYITFSLVHAGLSSKPTAPWHRAWCRKDEPRTRFSFSLPVAEERSGPVESARAPFHRPPVAPLHPLDLHTISLHKFVYTSCIVSSFWRERRRPQFLQGPGRSLCFWQALEQEAGVWQALDSLHE